MAANPASDFDLGPLTWVKTEIDHSLNQARENLDKLAANPADRAPAKYILTHLHQATGALAMVGLGAATRFNEELEKLVAYLEGEDAARLPGSVAVAKKGISALSTYLDSLLGGQPDSPMRLLAPYLELNRTRGQVDANEGDLFYPDLSAQLPPLPKAEALDDTVLAKALALQRQQYQQGLLRVIKGTDVPDAMRQMHAAVVAIESLQADTSNRPFWSAAAGFLDALVFGGLDLTPAVKPLFAKLDQQVKQLIEGSGKVAERLFRDLLLMVGRARPVSERIATLKQAYHLEQLIAVPDRGRQSSEDDEELMSLVREVRDLAAQQKDTWLKYTSGNRAALEPFSKQGQALAVRAARLPNRDILAVLQRLTEVAPQLRAKAIPPSEAQALEVATAMLFIESALENYFKLGTDFTRQAKTVTERLKSAMAGEPLPPMDAIEGGLLDEMTRRAQEKLLIFQVGQEVQVNLQNIEQALDGFFRDASKRPDLAGLPAQFAQVQGALMIMELLEAASLNAAVMARVQQFAEGSLDGSGEAADMVADGLSALGLYVTALQQGVGNPRETLTPALLRFGLVEAEPVGVESVIRRTGTVSPLDIEVQKQKVQALYKDWTGAPQEATREKLEKAVDELKRDAAVVSDAAVAKQSEAALQAIQHGSNPQQTGVFQAIQSLAPENAPETPTAQVVQLVDAPGAEIDKELLDIFLEEAAEVVDTISSNLETCRESPHDRESLTTIRRGFHTLKGSGRMVGLMELGEVAWQCEQVLNKWLKDEKPATAPLLDFIDLAQHSFSRWVGELKEAPSASIDATEITRRADALKSGEEIKAPAPAPVVETPAVAEATPARVEESAEFEFEPPIVHTPLPPVVTHAPAAAAEALSFLDEPASPAEEPAPVPFDAEATAIVERPAEEPVVAEAAPEPEAPKVPEFSFESLDLAPAQSAPAVEEVHAPAPVAEMAELDDLIPAGTVVESVSAEEEPEAEPETRVGNVVVPRALFEIYIGEAEQHVAALHTEMSRIEADPLHPVGADFMRAAHTLASTSRTTGFETVADVSHALEKWLQEAMEVPPEFDAHRLAATRRSVDALTAMVQSVRGLAEPFPREEIIVELTELRDTLRQARQTG
ncbi:MAG TPA: Hpt domain-containing protein, partial [Usitatibacter sp.]